MTDSRTNQMLEVALGNTGLSHWNCTVSSLDESSTSDKTSRCGRNTHLVGSAVGGMYGHQDAAIQELELITAMPQPDPDKLYLPDYWLEVAEQEKSKRAKAQHPHWNR